MTEDERLNLVWEVRLAVRQELARALHPSVRLEIAPDPSCFDVYVSRPANDPEQPDEPPPPNHAA